MLVQVLPNKFAAEVHEGDVEADQLGLHRRDLRSSGIRRHDGIIVYSFGERRPCFLRTYCYIVEVEMHSHEAFDKASRGYALLSPDTMALLNLENGSGLIMDPMVVKRAGELFKKASDFLSRQS